MKELAARLEQTAIVGDLTAAAAALPDLSARIERTTLIMETFCHEESDQMTLPRFLPTPAVRTTQQRQV
jgi:hypothetical protein